MKTEIYIATHKQVTVPAYAEYLPIHVGSALSNKDFGYCRDDTGDNISILNPNFCELTGLYWMYKHSQADILGLVHYRRYFMQSNQILNAENFDYTSLKNKILVAKLEKFYLRNSIINVLTLKKMSVKQQYSIIHFQQDWMLLKDVVTKLYPDYLASFEATENSLDGLSPYNMFIGDANIVKDYCEWLFNILFYIKDKLDISGYDDYQKRVYGFMAERLLNVYLHHHKDLDIIYQPVKMIEEK